MRDRQQSQIHVMKRNYFKLLYKTHCFKTGLFPTSYLLTNKLSCRLNAAAMKRRVEKKPTREKEKKEREREMEKRGWVGGGGEAPRCAFLSAVPAIIYARFRAVYG